MVGKQATNMQAHFNRHDDAYCDRARAIMDTGKSGITVIHGYQVIGAPGTYIKVVSAHAHRCMECLRVSVE